MSDIKRLAKLREQNKILLDQLRQNQENVKGAIGRSKRRTPRRSPRQTPTKTLAKLQDTDVSTIFPDYRDRSPIARRTRLGVRVEKGLASSTPKRPKKPRSATPTRSVSPGKRSKQIERTPDTTQEMMVSFMDDSNVNKKGTLTEKDNVSESANEIQKSLSPSETQETLSQTRYSEFLNANTERSRRDGLRQQNKTPHYSEKLLADGNDRRQASMAREMMKRPKSILMTPGGKHTRTPSKVHVSFMSPDERQPIGLDERQTQPLLGYDWIAGLLDNDHSVAERSQGFFDELKEFRRVNNDECFHRSFAEVPKPKKSPKSIPTPKTETQQQIEDEDEHTCIHSYALNSRLYPLPIHKGTDGDSECPICKTGRRREERKGQPSYIRVSIPRSTLASPYRLRPHRRRSFDPTDSFALSEHCLAGWESSKPSMMPSASTMDLKDSLDVVNKAAAMSTIGKWADKVPVSLSPSKKTMDLLNKSRTMRYGMQRLEKEKPWETNSSSLEM